MNSEEERERATVYMEGLAEMYKDWVRKERKGRRANDTLVGQDAREHAQDERRSTSGRDRVITTGSMRETRPAAAATATVSATIEAGIRPRS